MMKKQYKIIKLPKGDGNFRTIYAPSKAYKEKLQSFLLDLQQKLHNEDEDYTIHAFMRGRGPVSNAQKHVGYAYTLSFDLKDFFDSVTVEMVKGYLSEEERELCFIDGVARQGLPTSPLMANFAFLKVDALIKNAIAEEGIYTVYTRYADDLIFSFNHEDFASTLTHIIKRIIKENGFVLNEKKTKLQSAKSGRRIITGIGVGERAIYPSRKLKRRIRAAVHQKNREKAFGLLSWAECKEPRAFYTDRDLLNKNIFEEEALDLSNDFYLSNFLSFEEYVSAVEADFGNVTLAHETDRTKWEQQKSVFLSQRAEFYVKEKKRAASERQETRKYIEKRLAAEEHEKKDVQKSQPKKAASKPLQQASAATDHENEPKRPKELNVDFDTLKEAEKEQVATFEDEKKARRRQKEKISFAAEEKEEKKKTLNKVFMASMLPIILIIAAMSYYFSSTEVTVKATYPLFVETEPYDARIQIMNIIDKYKMGIELKPGVYDIRISKKGYTTQRFKIEMKHENIIIKRELKKIKVRKVY